MEKKCFKCKEILSLDNFYTHPEMLDGHVNKCKECNKHDVRKNYADKIVSKKIYDKHRQRYSIHRILNHRYNALKYRSTTKVYGRPYKVYGKDFLTVEAWNIWCYKDEVMKKFMDLYNNWVQNDFDNKLTPSVDRINNNIGYVAENLQWLTKSDNSSKATKEICQMET